MFTKCNHCLQKSHYIQFLITKYLIIITKYAFVSIYYCTKTTTHASVFVLEDIWVSITFLCVLLPFHGNQRSKLLSLFLQLKLCTLSFRHLTVELAWLTRLLHVTPVTIKCDSHDEIHIGRNPVFDERTKHFDIDWHFVHFKLFG